MNKTHLFLFTIGPVQSFIAQARKTMDLKAGSDMLSQLILSGIRKAENSYGANLIFPYLPLEELPTSMPNKFLAEVDIEPADAQVIGRAVEQQVREDFRQMAKDALKNMKLKNFGEAFETKFFSQIDTHLEVYWLFEEVNSEDDYRRAYQRIEQNLGAIKNIRAFGQLPQGEDGRKCSVSGERDALVFNDKFKLPAFVKSKQIAKIQKSPILISSGEGLSAVVATKRFHSEGEKFSSIAEIAALALQREMKGTLTEPAFNCYKGMFGSEDWDGQFLFDENVTDHYLKKNGISHKTSSNEALRRQLKQLKQKAREDYLPGISSYYALLNFDGDRMGAIWAGDKAFLKPEVSLKTFQKDLAKHLFYFAQKARIVLDQGKGQTIYAGGDDFTGFVNLYYLFDVLRELRSLYQTEVHDKLQGYLVEGVVLSFSAGICIAHYKTPLGEVVRYAHKAQDFAKDEDGGKRNAVAFYLMKRSGEIQRAAIKWGGGLENLQAVETCTKLMQEGCFSNTFITVLHDEIMGLVGREKKGSTEFDDFDLIIEQEIRRLIRRSRIETGIKEYLKKNQGEKEEQLVKAMQSSVLRLFKFKEESNIENFLHWLQIADFLNRQPDQNAN